MEKQMEGRKILITGGTGSLGHALAKRLLLDKSIEKVIVYSRDEYKQSLMEGVFPDERLRFFIGDVRDKNRMVRALQGVDTVIHAAALKRVPSLEYNPTEAVKTNVLGTMNVVEACFTAGVSTAVLISTDKAVNPVNLYGATKLTGEKIFLAANAFNRTKFTAVRYGNVIGSRGSVIPLFQRLAKEGDNVFPITSIDMTRFWITLDEAVDLVFYAIENPIPKVIVPHIPSMKIVDVAEAVSPDCEFKCIGKRAGEKLHETLISEDETNAVLLSGGKLVSITDYRSDNNDLWMTKEELRKKL
jgi:UDP-N-acetylglucosamine 4,6-dehydratase